MVWRVVWHVLWRNRWMAIVGAGFALPLSLLTGAAAQRGLLFVPICFASMMVFLHLVPAMTRREFFILPMTRRERWLSTWSLVCALPAVFVGGALLLSDRFPVPVGSGGALRWSDLFVVTSVTVAVSGTLMSALALAQVVIQGLRSRGGRRDGLVRESVTLAFVGVLVLVFVVREAVPLTAAAAGTMTGGLSVGVGMVITLAGAFYRPVLMIPPPADPAGGKGPLAARLGERPDWLFDDSFVGLTKLVVREVRFEFVVVGGMVLAFVASMAAMAFLWPGVFEDFSTELPFSSRPERLFPILWFAFLVGMGRDGSNGFFSTNLLCATARSLRTLPVSVPQLAVALVFRRALPWTAAWSALLFVQLTVVGWPELWRLEWLLFIIAVDAVIDALRFNWGAPATAVFAGTFGLFSISAVVGLALSATGSTAASVALACVGVVGIVFAYRIQLDNVRAGSDLYQEEAADTPLWSFK